MYVCVCNAIRESELRCAAQRSSGDAESVFALLGRQPDCRSCLEEAEEILLEERETSSAPSLAAVAARPLPQTQAHAR